MGFFRQSPRDLLAAAGEEAIGPFRHVVPDAPMRLLEAVLQGAIVAAEHAIKQVPPLKALFGSGEGDKPGALLEVFTLAMLSRWLAYLEEFTQTETVAAARMNGGAWVLEAFEDPSEDRLNRFCDLDVQYRYEKDNQAASSIDLECRLRWAEACEALGAPTTVGGWPSEGFPFAGALDLWQRGGFGVRRGPDWDHPELEGGFGRRGLCDWDYLEAQMIVGLEAAKEAWLKAIERDGAGQER